MIRFNNDYNISAHPAILKAMSEDAGNSYPGYLTDTWVDKARKEIYKYIDCPEAAIHFCVGATQANFVVIGAALRPFESVVCADTGHINVHEAGSVEHVSRKIEPLPGKNGKITAEQIDRYVGNARNSEVADHITQPNLVYISFPTEFGSIYSKAELQAIRKVCDKYGMYLFIDGARLGYGLGAADCDVTAADLTALADVYYFGGTKCGCLFGEAIVIRNKTLQYCFRNYMKQSGAILAKGWLLGIQFATLFENGLYFDLTAQADKYAIMIKEAFNKKGIPSYIESSTNQQFVVVTKEQAAQLAEGFIYENEDVLEDGRLVVRFCTSWATTEADAQALVDAIGKLN